MKRNTQVENHLHRPMPVKCGFTLIEILVVLGILSVLSAILFTAISRVKESGRRTVCLNNLAQLALGVQQYVADYDGRYLLDGVDFKQIMLPYVKNEELFYCPSNRASGRMIEDLGTYAYDTLRLSHIIVPHHLDGRSEVGFSDLSLIWVNRDTEYNVPATEISCQGTDYPSYTLHSGGSNHSFADGHVKWLSPEAYAQIECSLGAPNVHQP